MKNYFSAIIVICSILLTGSILSGCTNTVKGVGQDMDKMTAPRS